MNCLEMNTTATLFATLPGHLFLIFLKNFFTALHHLVPDKNHPEISGVEKTAISAAKSAITALFFGITV